MQGRSAATGSEQHASHGPSPAQLVQGTIEHCLLYQAASDQLQARASETLEAGQQVLDSLREVEQESRRLAALRRRVHEARTKVDAVAALLKEVAAGAASGGGPTAVSSPRSPATASSKAARSRAP